MCQDREGFMWFGTMDGLNKYDGYHFTAFKPDPRNPTQTLRHNIISAIHEDHKGRLWVATYGGGLHQIDKRTGKATAYPIRSTAETDWNVIASIYEDPDGMIWTGSNGLARLNPETKQYTLFPTKNYVGLLLGDPKGRIWYPSSGGLIRFDRATGKTRSFPFPSQKPSAGFIDAKGIFWVGTVGEGLFWADTQRDSLQFTPYNPKGVFDSTTNCRRIYEDPKHFLWLATVNGLLRINRQTDEVVSIPSAPWHSHGLGESLSFRMLSDRAGNLWVGGYNGIYKLIANPKPFQAHQLQSTPSSVLLSDNKVTSLLEDHTGAVWLANTGSILTGGLPTTSGFYRIDPISNQVNRIRINPQKQRTLPWMP